MTNKTLGQQSLRPNWMMKAYFNVDDDDDDDDDFPRY
jgi:hypothetical protein